MNPILGIMALICLALSALASSAGAWRPAAFAATIAAFILLCDRLMTPRR